MKKTITVLAILLSVLVPVGAAVAEQYSLMVSMVWRTSTQKLDFVGAQLVTGEAPSYLNQPVHGYSLIIEDADGKNLYATKFTIPRPPAGSPPGKDWIDPSGVQVKFRDPDEPSGLPTIQSVPIDLAVAYFLKARTGRVLDPAEQEVLSFPIPASQDLITTYVVEVQASNEKLIAQEAAASTGGENVSASSIAVIAIILVALGLFAWLRRATKTEGKLNT